MADDLSDLFEAHREKVNQAEKLRITERDTAHQQAEAARAIIASEVEPILHETAEAIRKNGYQADVTGPSNGAMQPRAVLSFVPLSAAQPRQIIPSLLEFEMGRQGWISVSVTANGMNSQRAPDDFAHDARFVGRPLKGVDADWVRHIARAFVDEVLKAVRHKAT